MSYYRHNIEVDKNTQIKYDVFDIDNLSDVQKINSELSINHVFEGHKLCSRSSDLDTFKFTGTLRYEDAEQLMCSGWTDVAKKLEEKFKHEKVKAGKTQSGTTPKSKYDVMGYQASVPRYLQGIPTNMIRSVSKPCKQKIVSLYKDISYNCGYTQDQIITESIKAMEVVRRIEAGGQKVKLGIVIGSHGNFQRIKVRIIIKQPNERLNISKLAFPLVHPSMLRRMFLSLMERLPEVTDSDFHWGYGTPLSPHELQSEGSIIIPRVFSQSVDEFIKSVQEKR